MSRDCHLLHTYTYNFTMKEKLALNIWFVFKGPVRFIGRSGSDCEMLPRLPSECRSPSGDLLRPDSLMVLHLCSPSQLHPSGRPQTLQTVMATCSPPWCTAALHCTQWSFCRISLQTPRGCGLDPDTLVLALNAARSRHWQPFRQKHPFKAQPGNGTQRTPGNNFLLIRSGCLIYVDTFPNSICENRTFTLTLRVRLYQVFLHSIVWRLKVILIEV